MFPTSSMFHLEAFFAIVVGETKACMLAVGDKEVRMWQI